MSYQNISYEGFTECLLSFYDIRREDSSLRQDRGNFSGTGDSISVITGQHSVGMLQLLQ